jgi:hypothetical protein
MNKITKIVTAASALGVMGLAVLPVASYAADQPVNVTVTVGSTLTFSAPTSYSADFGAAANKLDTTGGVSASGATFASPGTATITSNDPYNITVKSTGADTDLHKNGATSTIIATSATVPSAEAGITVAGYAINWGTVNSPTLSATPKAVTTSAQSIATNAPAAVNDTYPYGFKSWIASTTPSGNYTGGVTFTATN